jgi:zinc resistance-associated protein
MQRITRVLKLSAPMKSGLAKILMTAAVTGSAIALPVLTAQAEPPAVHAPMQKQDFSGADRAAFLDARIATLHAGLKLTPEQERLWPSVESALRMAARNAMESYQKFKNAPAGGNLVDQIRQRGESAVVRGQNLQAIADAAAPLYAALSEEQRHRLPLLIRGLTQQLFRHRFALTGNNREYWRRHWGEQGGMEPIRRGDMR